MKNIILLLLFPFLMLGQTQIGQDIDGEASGDSFGNSVSLSSDGTVVAIGAVFNNGNGTDSGHVRIYENISGVWTQIGVDIDGEATDDRSGYSVSLSSDGSFVAIGAIFNDGNGNESGQVRVYQNVSGVWTQVGSDIDGEAAVNRSGYSVSLSSDSSVLAIGAPDNNGDQSGHVRVYENISGVWTQVGDDLDGEFNDYFGRSVSLSSDGSVVVIGAPYNDGNGNNSGHVRVYDLSEVLSSNEFVLSQFSLYPNPAQNQINIQLQEGLELKQVNIYNTLGQFISTSKEKVIDTSHLSPGMYLIEIETNQGKATKQLIIE